MKTTHPPPAPPPFSARCGTAILLFAISHFLSGCTPKLSLTGDPSTSSIVVVRCKSTWRAVALLGMKESQKIVGGTLLSADVKGPKNRTTMVNGEAVDGLIIFSDVSPGVYQLARVQAYRYVGDLRSGSGHILYNVPGEQVLNYVFSVKAGEPKYFGVVTVDQTTKFIEDRVDFGLKPSSKEEEIAAWEKLIGLYPDSLWANAMQKRISELKQ
jgi:hypothetical protein